MKYERTIEESTQKNLIFPIKRKTSRLQKALKSGFQLNTMCARFCPSKSKGNTIASVLKAQLIADSDRELKHKVDNGYALIHSHQLNVLVRGAPLIRHTLPLTFILSFPLGRPSEKSIGQMMKKKRSKTVLRAIVLQTAFIMSPNTITTCLSVV